MLACRSAGKHGRPLPALGHGFLSEQDGGPDLWKLCPQVGITLKAQLAWA